MRTLIAVVFFACAGIVISSSNVVADEQSPSATERVALAGLLDTVSRKSGEQFLQHENVRPQIVVGSTTGRDVTLSTLHTILRNNRLAAVRSEGIVNVVPEALVRQYPLRVIETGKELVPADEWVIQTLRPERAYANQLVPLLRPMVPQAGHLFADAGSNTLTIVAPYGVAVQLQGMAEAIDAQTPARRKQAP